MDHVVWVAHNRNSKPWDSLACAEDYLLSNFLHSANCDLLDPCERSLQELITTVCGSPTVGANCCGINTSDVLGVRT